MSRRFRNEVENTGEAEMATLGQFIKPGDLALDIGANLGGYTYEMARLCGRVIAFEPNPALFDTLKGLHFKGADIRGCAIGDKTGEAILHLPDGQRHVLASLCPDVVADYPTKPVKVAVFRLDDIALPPVSFIKIDVEGFEEAVLQGGQETIRRDLPTILVEIEERHNAGGLARIEASLAELGYSGHFLLNEEWQPLSDFHPGLQNVEILSATHTTRRGLRYINNFLFVHGDHPTNPTMKV